MISRFNRTITFRGKSIVSIISIAFVCNLTRVILRFKLLCYKTVIKEYFNRSNKYTNESNILEM